MEGRRRDAGPAADSGATFAGRQMPLEMGTVRVGGSGRPVPALFSAAAVKQPRASSTAGQTPHVVLEPNPRSPFSRKIDVPKTLVTTSEDTHKSRFQVNKTTVSHPRSVRSPHVRQTPAAQVAPAVAAAVAAVTAVAKSTERRVRPATGTKGFLLSEMHAAPAPVAGNGIAAADGTATVFSTTVTGDGGDERAKTSRLRKTSVPPAQSPLEKKADVRTSQSNPQSTSLEKNAIAPRAIESNVSPTVQQFIQSPTEKSTTPKVTVKETKSGSVTVVPSLVKFQNSISAKDLALLTRRVDKKPSSSGAMESRSTQARFHEASRLNPEVSATLTPPQPNAQKELKPVPRVGKRSLPSSMPVVEKNKTHTTKDARSADSSWRQVDTSMYDDPALDLVQMHLQRSSNSVSAQKKRKVVERERVLAAASDLREHRSEAQRLQEQRQCKKAQLQEMSEAIRLRNQKLVKPQASYATKTKEKKSKTDLLAASTSTGPQRRPAVPRLSGKKAVAKQPKRKKKKKRGSTSHTGEAEQEPGVSASILLGDASVLQEKAEGVIPDSEIEDEKPYADEIREVDESKSTLQAPKRKSTVASKPLKKKKHETQDEQPQEDLAVVKARKERRALAREYIKAQKHSRKVWSAKQREQAQFEQEKRQQQLEILEATRLKNLRLANQRQKAREKRLANDIKLASEMLKANECATSPTNNERVLGAALGSSSKTDNVEWARDVQSVGSLEEKNRLLMEEQLDDAENDGGQGNVMAPALCSGGSEVGKGPTSLTTVTGSGDGAAWTEGLTESDLLDESPLRRRNDEASSLPESVFGDSADDHPTIDDTPEVNASTNRTSVDSEGVVKEPHINGEDRNSDGEGGRHYDGNEECVDDEELHEHDDECDASLSEDKFSFLTHHSDLVDGAGGIATSAGQRNENDEEDVEGPEDVSTTRLSTRYSYMDHQNATIGGSEDMMIYDEDMDLDIRSIGVHDIRVVWPMVQLEDKEELVQASEVSFASQSVSSVSSSSVSSPSGSSSALSRTERAIIRSDSRFGIDRDTETAAKAAFHKEVCRGLAGLSASIEEDTVAPSAQDRFAPDLLGDTGEDADSNPDADQTREVVHKFYGTTAVHPIGRQAKGDQSPRAKDQFLRLLRETDDSLSVIDRAAKQLYKKQLEESARAKEKRRQEELEIKIHQQLQKDQALETIIDSLTGKEEAGSVCELSSAGHDARASGENECDAVEQYRRLDEIMAEVEKERTREEKETDGSPPVGELSFESSLDEEHVEQKPRQLDQTMQNIKPNSTAAVVASSPAFWDHLVSKSIEPRRSELQHLGNFGEEPHLNTDGDDSGLAVRLEYRLRQQKALAEMQDSQRGVSLPRALSERLLEAVDHQEQTYEAHIRRLIMEHATLEKRLDGGLHDVVQQLEFVREKEQREKRERSQQEGQRTSVRECSIQTDAAASAVMHVEGSTSPDPIIVDAPVQYAIPEHEAGSSGMQFGPGAVLDVVAKRPSVSEGDDEDAYSEETFENDSQVQIDERIKSEPRVSSAAPSISDDQAYSEDTSKSDSETNYLRSADLVLPEEDESINSDGVKSVSERESVSDDDPPISDVASVVEDDEQIESGSDKDHRGDMDIVDDMSASVGYEDDFEASSPKQKMAGELSDRQEVDEDGVDEDMEETFAHSVESGVGADDIEEDDFDGKSGYSEIGSEAFNDQAVQYSTEFDEASMAGATRNESAKAEVVRQSKLSERAQDIATRLPKTHEPRGGSELAAIAIPAIGTPSLYESEGTQGVEEPYIVDLERRKQTEESLITLRFHAVEYKFRHETALIDKSIQSAQSDDTKVDLHRRKEVLTMAFLAEKANVDSLRAASTARYYQDLHAFRSIALDWPPTVTHAAMPVNVTKPASGFVPVSIVGRSTLMAETAVMLETANKESSQSDDEYADEFESVRESGNGGVNAEPAAQHSDDEIAVESKIPDIPKSDLDMDLYPEDVQGVQEVDEIDEIDGIDEVDDINDDQVEKDDAAIRAEDSGSVADADDQYEDEFASASESASVVETAAGKETEIIESDGVGGIQEDTIPSEDLSVGAGSDYEDEFDSVSESASKVDTLQAAAHQHEVEVDDEVSVGGPGSAEEEVSMEEEGSMEDEQSSTSVADEISDDAEVVYDESGSHSNKKEVQGERAAGSADRDRRSSDDDFECSQLDQNVGGVAGDRHKALGDESAAAAVGQSSSEDSSTTKLMITEVETLQMRVATTATKQTETEGLTSEDNKLSRKKIKAIELLQAKVRLLQQQKMAFRREEERKQVDVIAKLALGMDIEEELRSAKAEIAQQLASEFDELQQAYPMLKVASARSPVLVSGMSKETPSILPTQNQHGNGDLGPLVAMPKVQTEEVVYENEAEADDDGDDYDVESFEEEQSEIHDDDEAELSEKVAGFASNGTDQEQEVSSIKEQDLEVVEKDDEIASEVPSDCRFEGDDGEVPDDVVDEEGSDDRGEHEDVDDATKEESVDYSNDYDDDSFDEAQSAASIPSDQSAGDGNSPPVEATAPTTTLAGAAKVDDVLVAAVEDEDEGEGYSDEGFDSTFDSGFQSTPSILQPASDTTGDSECTAVANTPGTENVDVDDNVLCEATASVMMKLATEQSIIDSAPKPEADDVQQLRSEASAVDGGSLVESVSVSLSRDEEDELLTKSIEERNARLEQLKQQILDRKSELVAVQKQMCIERRKEQLSAAEALLWDEMEGVERALRADVAALELSRQRNRLEAMHLEGRKKQHAVSTQGNDNSEEHQVDLLVSFDYVEDTELPVGLMRTHLQTTSEIAAHPGQRNPVATFDLLEDYVYVETAEFVSVERVEEPTSFDAKHLKTDANDVQEVHEEETEKHCETTATETARSDGSTCGEGGDGSGVNYQLPNNELSPEHTRGDVHEVELDAATAAAIPESEDSTMKVTRSIAGTGEDKTSPVVACSLTDSHVGADPGLEHENLHDSLEDNVLHEIVEDTQSPHQDPPDCWDLLAEFDHIEDTQPPEVVELASVGLLASFEYVEIAEVVEQPTWTEFGRNEPLVRDALLNDSQDEEKEDASEILDLEEVEQEVMEEERPVSDEVAGIILAQGSLDATSLRGVYPTETQIPPFCSDTENAGGKETLPGDNSGEVTGNPAVADEPFGCNAEEWSVDPGPTVSEALVECGGQKDTVDIDVERAERVTALLFADILQALGGDVADYRTNTTASPNESKLLAFDSTERELATTTIAAKAMLEVAIHGIEPSNGVTGSALATTTETFGGVNAPGKVVSNADTHVIDFAMDTIIDGEAESAPSDGDYETPSLKATEAIDQEPSRDFEAESEAGNEVQNVREIGDDERGMSKAREEGGRDSVDDLSSEAAADVQDGALRPEEIQKSERVADGILATVCDEIITSEVRVWSLLCREEPRLNKPPRQKPLSIAVTMPSTEAVLTTREVDSPRRHEYGIESLASDGQLVQQITDQLEIVDEQIRLPEFDCFSGEEGGSSSQTARVLYDTIEELARDYFHTIRQSTPGAHSNVALLATIRQHVLAETHELLAIRGHAQDELDRRTQLFSNELGDSTDVTNDLLLMLHCVSPDVAGLVAKAQTQFTRTAEPFAPASKAQVRTPTASRVKKPSLISALQTQQEHELQQRVTSMILDDLLEGVVAETTT